MAATVAFNTCMGLDCVGFDGATCEHVKLHGDVKNMVALQEVPLVSFNAYMENTKKCSPRYGVDAVGANMVVMSELSCMKFKACCYFNEMRNQTGEEFTAALFAGDTITIMMTRVNELDQFVVVSDDLAPPHRLKSIKDWYN